MVGKKNTIHILIPEIVKLKEKYPKCVYADWMFCWQRVSNSYTVQEYGAPDEKQCAACLSAFINWGTGATRRPMNKEEIKKEKELKKEKLV